MARRYCWLAVIVGTVLAASVVAVLVSAAPRSRLQGVWVGDGIRLTFQGHLAVMERESSSRQRTYFRLEPRASPPRITLFDADAPSVVHPVGVLGITLWGPSPGPTGVEGRFIYELQGDRLRIGMPPPVAGAGFPAGFESADTVLELRRE
jgi:hypothetical protein